MLPASGQPSYMNVIPKFNLEDIDAGLGSGVHPAFIVGGVEKSELFIGTYQGINKNGEFLSLPGVDPTVSQNFDYFANLGARQRPWLARHQQHRVHGAGAGWCWKNGYMPRGNSNYGRSSDATWETGRRADGGTPGDTSATCRHADRLRPGELAPRQQRGGIADLCGNIWEWSPGLRVVQGEIQVIANNDAALNATDLSATSSAWKAIDGDTDCFINPTFTGSIAAWRLRADHAEVRPLQHVGHGELHPGAHLGPVFRGHDQPRLHPGFGRCADRAEEVRPVPGGKHGPGRRRLLPERGRRTAGDPWRQL